MNIDGVENGIVLDHIQAGKSMEVYRLLQLDKLDCSVAVIQNAKSTKYDKKDIIKIDEMIHLDMDILGYIDPNITINLVENNRLIQKSKTALPKKLTNVISCKNPRCITSIEQEIQQIFYLADEEKQIYRCMYCDVEYS